MAQSTTRTRVLPAILALGALAAAAAPSLAQDGAFRRPGPPPGPAPVVVDVDALGLIEAWWAHEVPPRGMSTAIVTQSGTHGLMRCQGAEALYVEVLAPGGGAPVARFSCRPGEALVAVPGFGVECRAGGFAASGDPTGRGEIVLEGSGRPEILAGRCIGPSGATAAALVSLDILRPDAAPAVPCPQASSVSIGGQVVAGGC